MSSTARTPSEAGPSSTSAALEVTAAPEATTSTTDLGGLARSSGAVLEEVAEALPDCAAPNATPV